MLADKYYLLNRAVEEKGFSIQPVSDQFTQSQYYERAEELFGMNGKELTQYLWDTYNPLKCMVPALRDSCCCQPLTAAV